LLKVLKGVGWYFAVVVGVLFYDFCERSHSKRDLSPAAASLPSVRTGRKQDLTASMTMTLKDKTEFCRINHESAKNGADGCRIRPRITSRLPARSDMTPPNGILKLTMNRKEAWIRDTGQLPVDNVHGARSTKSYRGATAIEKI
jgi:hypothetical protein